MEGFDLYFGLKLGKLIYSHADKLSQTLQNEKMSAVSSKSLAKLTIDTIAGIRNEESFNALYDVAVKESKNIPFVEEPVLKEKRKVTKYSVLNFVKGYSSTSPAHHPASPRDQYREQYYQAIDLLVSSVNDRFDNHLLLYLRSWNL